jgi:hypothetical protein
MTLPHPLAHTWGERIFVYIQKYTHRKGRRAYAALFRTGQIR